MFIYFDRNGVLQEVINDKAARLGDLNANEIYVYVDEVELDDIWLTLKRPDGTLSVEKSFIANKVVREIPYDPKRDMKFFKDFKEYEFYKFTISDEITIEGVYQATIRMTYEDTLSALGVLVFKAETGVIKSDQNITQAQYDYLIWYVGSWQGQIGDLEEAMGIAQADILNLQQRMNVAEQDINKIEDGTTVVSKALKDDLGNTIKSTYANKLDLVYSSINNRIAITLKSYDGNSIDADLITLPKATTSADGLLSKEDKAKVDALWTLLENNDENFVDTITELLEIFENYPEAMDIVTEFAKKADKTYVDNELALKADKLVLTNLVSNGDLLTPKPSPNENEPLSFTYLDATDITLVGGVAKFTATAQFGRINAISVNSTNYIGNRVYVFARFKSDSDNVRLTFGQFVQAYHPGDGNFNFLSMINDVTASDRNPQVSDYRSSGWTPIEVDYIGVIDLTATFGAGKEPTKEQMDAIIRLKGYFETTDITIKDLMLELDKKADKADIVYVDDELDKKVDIDYLLDKSTNLINYENMVHGYYVNQTTGLLEVGANYRASDYIKVIGGEKYTIYSVGRYAFYDKNKVYISGSMTASRTVPNTLTAPANAVYLRFSTDLSLTTLPLKLYQVNKGDTLLAFEPYWVRIKPKFIKVLEDETVSFNETDFVKLGKNLFDYTTSTDGYYVNQTNGEVAANASYYISDYINIDGNENYYISGVGALRIAFYDINGKFISGIFNDPMPILSPATAKSMRFSAYVSAENPKSLVQVEKGSVMSAFEPYGYQFTKSNKLMDSLEEPLIVLPPKLYAIAGKELNIYFDNILNFDYKKYDFDVACDVGEQWQRRFKYVPSADGTFPITIKVLEKNIEKSVATSSIIVKAPTVGNGVIKKIIVIGDSTTANGIAVAKLNENFANDAMTLQTLGTKGTSPNNHEGISGWTIGMLKSTESNAHGTNAFFNQSTSLFDFSYYMANSGVDVPDYVVINLGINDTFGATNDSQLTTKINQLKLDYQFIIDSIFAYSPSIKIGIAITIPPNYSQDAFGKAYNSDQTRWRYKRNNFLWMKELINYFKNKEEQNIYLIPINTNLDTEYNMGFESEQVNARNTTMINVPIGNGGVHPDASGYHQIADVYWYWLKSFES